MPNERIPFAHSTKETRYLIKSLGNLSIKEAFNEFEVSLDQEAGGILLHLLSEGYGNALIKEYLYTPKKMKQENQHE